MIFIAGGMIAEALLYCSLFVMLYNGQNILESTSCSVFAV